MQISTDGLSAYMGAMENAFGSEVDYAQIIKVYGAEETHSDNVATALPDFVSSEKKVIVRATQTLR